MKPLGKWVAVKFWTNVDFLIDEQENCVWVKEDTQTIKYTREGDILEGIYKRTIETCMEYIGIPIKGMMMDTDTIKVKKIPDMKIVDHHAERPEILKQEIEELPRSERELIWKIKLPQDEYKDIIRVIKYRKLK